MATRLQALSTYFSIHRHHLIFYLTSAIYTFPDPQVVDQSLPSSQPDPSPPTITESTSTPNIVDIPDIPYVIDPQ